MYAEERKQENYLYTSLQFVRLFTVANGVVFVYKKGW